MAQLILVEGTYVCWLCCRYAKFEMSVHEVVRARACYERALEQLAEDANTVSTHGLGDSSSSWLHCACSGGNLAGLV
jgi:hypothetical protein